MARYDHQTIERKWQDKWLATKRYHVDRPTDQSIYVLDMFPYPSGEGLHVGHPLGYIGSDIVARYFRAKGQLVLHPIGYDAFGLPAENYAIKKGVHPAETTQLAIERYRQQLQLIGLSYDWDREVNTADPNYYKWTQWLFLELYRKGLAYRAKSPVNWCPTDQTVLANEQVKDGRCERCEALVVQKELEQWFFKTTAYADELLAGLADLDWPEPIKLMQRNWIGKSEGALIQFPIANSQFSIEVFTTRPDTLFGATFLVLAPEHPFVENHKSQMTNSKQVEEYINQAKTKKELERKAIDKPKTGVEIQGIRAINPATREEMPIWVADYVLPGYGTGAIMAVPAHDERDWAFASAQNLPVKTVIAGGAQDQIYAGHGELSNSGDWDGWHSDRDKEKILNWIEEHTIGERKVSYRLRDWLVSRQRYWGAPIPIIHCQTCGEVPVSEDQLPLRLPSDVDFRPTGESPLARSEEFHRGVTCPKCGEPARREVDTMDTFVDSSWYFLRYPDAQNTEMPFDKTTIKEWLPVDWYVGGAEHAVLHLLYSRFITKVLADGDYLDFREPFTRLRNQGLILGEDHRKMSKRWGNVINPDDVVRDYGADALRAFEMFMGPFGDSKPWNTSGLSGVRRWLERVWRLQSKRSDKQSAISDNTERLLHQTIQKVTHDIENFQFNTAISALMILTNQLEREETIRPDIWQIYLQLLAPFAPHLAHELWEQADFSGFPDDKMWPVADLSLLTQRTVTLPVQVNGKVRGQLAIPFDMPEAEVIKAAQELPGVAKYLSGKKVQKTVLIPGRIVNLVVA